MELNRSVAPDAANAESQCPADAANAEAEEVILNKGHGVPAWRPGKSHKHWDIEAANAGIPPNKMLQNDGFSKKTLGFIVDVWLVSWFPHDSRNCDLCMVDICRYIELVGCCKRTQI